MAKIRLGFIPANDDAFLNYLQLKYVRYVNDILGNFAPTIATEEPFLTIMSSIDGEGVEAFIQNVREMFRTHGLKKNIEEVFDHIGDLYFMDGCEGGRINVVVCDCSEQTHLRVKKDDKLICVIADLQIGFHTVCRLANDDRLSYTEAHYILRKMMFLNSADFFRLGAKQIESISDVESLCKHIPKRKPNKFLINGVEVSEEEFYEHQLAQIDEEKPKD